MKIKIRNLRTEFLILFINTTLIVDLFRLLSKLNLFPIEAINPIRNLLYISAFIFVCYDAIKNNHVSFIIIPILVYGILVCFSLLRYSSIRNIIIEDTVLFIIRCLVGLYLARYANMKVVYDKQKKYYPLIFIYIALYFISYTLVGIVDTTGNYMTFSYNILIQVALYILYTIKNRAPFQLIVSFFYIVVLFTLGARGPLVAIFVSTGLYLVLLASNDKKIMKYLTITCATTLLIITNWSLIIQYLLKVFQDSRNLFIIVNKNFFDLTGRNELYSLLIQKITQDPFTPHGIFADRFYIMGDSLNLADATYVHNFFIEIIFNFGLLLGIFIIIGLIYYTIKVILIIKKQKSEKYMITMCALFTGFIALLFSGSYLANERFWLFLGFGIQFLTRNKIVQRSSCRNIKEISLRKPSIG